MVAKDRARTKVGVSVVGEVPLTMSRVLRRLSNGEALLADVEVERWKERLRALRESLVVVEEPRDRRGRKHPLVTVLVVAVLGSMCGADSADGMHVWACRQRKWLEDFVSFPAGVPSQDTILRVLAAIEPGSLHMAFYQWVDQVLGRGVAHGRHVSIDGKTLRRSGGGRGNEKPVHMVSALVASRNLVLGQVATDAKSNEITAIPQLLQMLSLREALVSIDAMGCQVEIARLIRSKSADYLLATKGNQGRLSNDVITAFDSARSTTHRPSDVAQPLKMLLASSTDSGHGRIEERTAHVIQRSAQPAEFDQWLPATRRWPDLAAIICVTDTRTSCTTGKASIELRYFITSRDITAEAALYAVRAHWAIENGLHWVLDVTFREDQSRVRTDNAAQNLAVVRHFAHSLLRRHTADKVSIAKRRQIAGYWPHYLEFVLGSPEPDTSA